MLVLQHTLLTQLLPHLTTSRTIRLQPQVHITKHNNHRHIMQPHHQRLYILLNPRIADLLLEDSMAHNEPLFLVSHLQLLLVGVVVVVISPTCPGLPRAVAEVER
jgi:hypothetical protein